MGQYGLKTEPSGEIAIGKLDQEQTKVFLGLLKDDAVAGSDFENEQCELNDIFQGWCAFAEGINDGDICDKVIAIDDLEDGLYSIYTSLSKGTAYWEIEGVEDEDIDEDLITVTYASIGICELECHYGDIEFDIITSLSYNGAEADFEDLSDRGTERSWHIIEVKDGELETIHYQQ